MIRVQHQLKPVKWRVILQVTDTPGPGEDYLNRDQIKEQLQKTGNMDAGVGFEFGSVELEDE